LFVRAYLCLEAGDQFIFCERHVSPQTKVMQKLKNDNLMANYPFYQNYFAHQ
jgi:hypothetical protein